MVFGLLIKMMTKIFDEIYFKFAGFQDVATKTKELLNNLKSLAGEDGTIALESLKERKMPPATENFLFNLAACEGLVQL
jgi:hypothetical protein